MRAAAPPLALTGQDLRCEDVARVAREKQPVGIAPAAQAAVDRSRAVVEAAVRDEKGKPVYGVTTGFGELATTRIPPSRARELQRNLVLSTAAGVGAPYPTEVVRAMMLLRANALAKGRSGIRRSTLDLLVSMLNAGVHPVVPSQGSVGASGDLAPLAHLALAMMGEGECEHGGGVAPAARALSAAGLAPVELAEKEGLSLINGTQAMTAMAALATVDGARLLATAQVAAAMSLEALLGSVAPFDPRLHEARPHPGQRAVAENLRKLLAGSGIVASHAGCDRVQDPYTLRCIPQVLGPARDALAEARRVVEIEANSANDNPLVLDADVVSGGNFHGQPIALVLAYLAPAMAEIASFAERRVARLVDPNLSEGLPAFLVPDSGVQSGYMIPQYVAAALVSENKQLAWPPVVDSIPTSANQEDHVSMGAHAALSTRRIVENAQRVVGVELLCAAQALALRAPLSPAPATAAALAAVRRRVPPLVADRYLKPEMDAAAELVASGEVLAAAESVCGPLA